MYISENELKRRILTGQIEILREVLTTLRQKREEKLLLGHVRAANTLMTITKEYSEYLTTLNREKLSLKPEK
jgi:hypothetical protein